MSEPVPIRVQGEYDQAISRKEAYLDAYLRVRYGENITYKDFLEKKRAYNKMVNACFDYQKTRRKYCQDFQKECPLPEVLAFDPVPVDEEFGYCPEGFDGPVYY